MMMMLPFFNESTHKKMEKTEKMKNEKMENVKKSEKKKEK